MIGKIKYPFALFLLLLLPFCSSAQLEADNWMFASNRYVTFNKATAPIAIPFPSDGFIGYSTTCYSDKNGQVLFYSDGNYLLNRDFKYSPGTNQNSVPIGHPLNGPFVQMTQGALAVPYPGHDSLFILFHIFCQPLSNFQSRLLYSIINMKLDNGKGDVDKIQRDIPVVGLPNVGFKLTAMTHCNKKDIWVIGHYVNSDKYFALLVTENGVSNTIVLSAGNFIPSPPNSSANPNNNGCMKISPLGNRMAAAFQGLDYIELGDFNTQTGIISNFKKINTTPPATDTVYDSQHLNSYGPIGVEFSPSGNRLYATSNYDERNITGIHPTAFIYQFDVSLNSEAQIQASRYFFGSQHNRAAGAIQLANTGKLYINVRDDLFEVSDPENLGSACNYTPDAVLLGNGSPKFNLPIFLQSYLRYPIIATGNCQFQNISFKIQNPVGVSNIKWDFGDPASGANNFSTSFTPTHIFTTQGVYVVKAILANSNGCGNDTITKVVSAGPFKVFLGIDTTICKGDTLELKQTIPGASYLWNNNSVNSSIKVTTPGKYWVKVFLGECSATDTIEVFDRNLPQFTLGKDTSICSNLPLTLLPKPDYTSSSYIWSDNTNNPTAIANKEADYWLQLTDQYGCKWRDTIAVSFKKLPQFDIGSNTSICEKDTLQLNATVSGSTNYAWSTGETYPIIKVYNAGIYWCDVTNGGCIYRDSLTLSVKPLPIVNLGIDTTLCEGQQLVLDAKYLNSTYLWQDGATASKYTVSKEGIYTVVLTMNGCVAKDDITVSYSLRPRFTLGNDRFICPGETQILQPAIDPLWQLIWQDGSSNAIYSVTQPGLYSLTATNKCGTTKDELLFTKGLCKIYVPNAFTPNNDSKNDQFKILGTEMVTSFHLQVFNRYGQLVFETKDKNRGWDGKRNGQPTESGTFVYLLSYKDVYSDKLQQIKGTFIIIR